MFGFTEVQTNLDDFDHPNGPAFAICALKVGTNKARNTATCAQPVNDYLSKKLIEPATAKHIT